MEIKINNNDIEKFRNKFKKAKPYSYVVIDNFFKKDLLDKVALSFPPLKDDKWFRFRDKIGDFDNIFESGMNAISKPDIMPTTCQSFLYNLNSMSFCKTLEKLTGIENIQPDDYWHYSGLRINTPGAHQLIHSDALFHPHLKKRKILTFMLYLTKNWKEEDEGCLEIWDNEMEKCVHKIEPLFNRVVIFENTKTSYHGVTKNNHFRKAITMSYLLNEYDENRWRALFVKRPQDNSIKNFDEIANARSKLNDTK
jgi:hypothetical protein